MNQPVDLPDSLSAVLSPQLTWQHFDCLSSTNTYLLDSDQPTNCLVSADRQTAGRGRRQQQWVDEGSSLLFSLSTATKTQDISAWPVQVAITLATTLEALQRHFYGQSRELTISIKWPNDLYQRQTITDSWAKCGGILVESCLNQLSGKVVTGVGLNLQPLKAAIVADYPIGYIALPLEKKPLTAVIANALFDAWQAFIAHPVVSVSTYESFDFLLGKAVMISDGKGAILQHGIAQGINTQGHLLVKQGEIIHSITSPERVRLLDIDTESLSKND